MSETPLDTVTPGARFLDAQITLPLGRFHMDAVRQAHPARWAQMLHPGPALSRVFLAEETVRLGGRGHAIVGLVFDGSQQLPLTGFEGYFLGTARDQDDPREAGRHDGEPRTPADIVRVIAALGARLLDDVEHDLDTRYIAYRDTAEREILRWIEQREMDEVLLHCLNGVYGSVLGVLRAHRNPALEAFRDETYRLLEGFPHIDVTATADAITLRYRVPRVPLLDRVRTTVVLDSRLRHGYAIMAAINPYLGNPVTRAYLHSGD